MNSATSARARWPERATVRQINDFSSNWQSARLRRQPGASLGAELTTLRNSVEQERSAARKPMPKYSGARTRRQREQLEAQLSHKDAEIGSLRASAFNKASNCQPDR